MSLNFLKSERHVLPIIFHFVATDCRIGYVIFADKASTRIRRGKEQKSVTMREIMIKQISCKPFERLSCDEYDIV